MRRTAGTCLPASRTPRLALPTSRPDAAATLLQPSVRLISRLVWLPDNLQDVVAQLEAHVKRLADEARCGAAVGQWTPQGATAASQWGRQTIPASGAADPSFTPLRTFAARTRHCLAPSPPPARPAARAVKTRAEAAQPMEGDLVDRWEAAGLPDQHDALLAFIEEKARERGPFLSMFSMYRQVFLLCC